MPERSIRISERRRAQREHERRHVLLRSAIEQRLVYRGGTIAAAHLHDTQTTGQSAATYAACVRTPARAQRWRQRSRRSNDVPFRMPCAPQMIPHPARFPCAPGQPLLRNASRPTARTTKPPKRTRIRDRRTTRASALRVPRRCAAPPSAGRTAHTSIDPGRTVGST